MGMDIGRVARRATLTLGLAALAACAPTQRFHGYVPAEAALAAVAIGDSRETVIGKIGQPTTAGALGDTALYYVRSVFEHSGFLAPEEVSREVVAVSFAAAGVSNVERFDLTDGRVVPITRRTTDATVADGSFLRQLAGAAGNFDAGALIGEE